MNISTPHIGVDFFPKQPSGTTHISRLPLPRYLSRGSSCGELPLSLFLAFFPSFPKEIFCQRAKTSLAGGFFLAV